MTLVVLVNGHNNSLEKCYYFYLLLYNVCKPIKL
jgi:hypothetical protein